MFLVFPGCFHLLKDVFKMCSDDLRCLEMFSNDHKCWMLDFSRSSLGVLLMFSGFSQDGHNLEKSSFFSKLVCVFARSYIPYICHVFYTGKIFGE